MTFVRSAWLTLTLIALNLPSLSGPAANAAGSGHSTTRASGACAAVKKNTPRGTIRYSDWQFPTTLNTNQTNLSSAFVTNELQNDNLVRYDGTAHLIPILLTVVPTHANGGISADGKTIRLVLKPGLHWSNGREITSHHIWFAWKIGTDRASGPACHGTCDKIASISTPSKYVAILSMKKVYASAVPRALPGIMIEAWKNAAGSWAKDNVRQAAFALYQNSQFNYMDKSYPTTGPYQVTRVAHLDRITLQPNPNYTNMTCGARVATIEFTWYPSKERMVAAAAKRETDVTLGYHPADLSLLRRSAGPYTVYDVPGFVYEHLEFNVDPQFNGHPNPLADHNVRLALALTVDKVGTISRALHVAPATARQIAAYNPWVWRSGLRQPFTDTSVTGQWDPIAHTYVQAGSSVAIRDAKKLLNKTSWKRGFTLDGFTTPLAARTKVLTSVTSNWAKLGVKLTTTPQPDDVLFGSWGEGGTLDRGKFQVALFSWVGSPDPDSWVNEMGGAYVDRRSPSHSNINQNYSGFKDSVIDRGFRAGSATYNGITRGKAYKAIQVEMNKQAYWVGLYYRDQISTSDGRVKHFTPNPTTAGVTWNGYNWST